MPIEIRELHIKATVREAPADGTALLPDLGDDLLAGMACDAGWAEPPAFGPSLMAEPFGLGFCAVEALELF